MDEPLLTATKQRVADLVKSEKVFGNKKDTAKLKNIIREGHSAEMYKKVKAGGRADHHFVPTAKCKELDELKKLLQSEPKWLQEIQNAMDVELKEQEEQDEEEDMDNDDAERGEQQIIAPALEQMGPVPRGNGGETVEVYEHGPNGEPVDSRLAVNYVDSYGYSPHSTYVLRR